MVLQLKRELISFLHYKKYPFFYTMESFSIKNISYIGKSISMAIGYVK